jgi:DNA-binding HxlR family transcriptional regulator
MVGTRELVCRDVHVRAINALRKKRKVSTTKLSIEVGHKSITQKLLKAYLENGLVTRTPLNDKRRTVIWELTEKGKKLSRLLNSMGKLDTTFNSVGKKEKVRVK